MKVKSIEEYKKELSNLNKNFEIIREIKESNKRRKFLFRHNCNCEFVTDFSSLRASILSGGGCPNCAKLKRTKNLNKKITLDEVQKFLIESGLSNEYKIDEIWYDSKIKRSIGKFYHVKCNRYFIKRINDFKNGYHCHFCSNEKKDSFLTIKIKDFLNKKGIEYKSETSIKELKRNGTNFLLNDFSIKNFFIESDGEQHFIQKKNREDLSIIRERDLSKDNYYFERKDKFTFLRIPYTEYSNIEKILENFFKKDFNELRKFKVMIISEKTIINYENEKYYEINKKTSKLS